MGISVAGYIALAGVAVSAVSSSQQATAGRHAATARNRQIEAQKKMQEAEIRKQRLEARRRARALTAQTLAGAEAAGAAGSSGAEGGASSIGSQLAGQQQFSRTQQGFQSEFLLAQSAEAKAQQTAQMWQSAGKIASSVGNQFGSWDWNPTKGPKA